MEIFALIYALMLDLKVSFAEADRRLREDDYRDDSFNRDWDASFDYALDPWDDARHQGRDEWEDRHERAEREDMEREMHAHYTALFAREDAEKAADLVAKGWDDVTARLERADHPRRMTITAGHKVLGHRRSVRFRHKIKSKRGVPQYHRPAGGWVYREGQPEKRAGRDRIPCRTALCLSRWHASN